MEAVEFLAGESEAGGACGGEMGGCYLEEEFGWEGEEEIWFWGCFGQIWIGDGGGSGRNGLLSWWSFDFAWVVLGSFLDDLVRGMVSIVLSARMRIQSPLAPKEVLCSGGPGKYMRLGAALTVIPLIRRILLIACLDNNCRRCLGLAFRLESWCEGSSFRNFTDM